MSDNFNYLPSVSGLEGCTSIIIIGEKGCWLSHFWEQPWFLGYKDNPTSGVQNFQQNVLNDLENGDGDNMPSPFAAGGQTQRIPELVDGDGGFKPEIRVITLMENGEYTYDTEVTLMEQALTGPGKAFEGCTVTRTGYARNQPDKRSANGKVLIQYTNEQETRNFEPMYCPAKAIYKVWVERSLVTTHEWAASGNQVPDGAPGKMKRAAEPVCSLRQTGTFTAAGTNTANPTATDSVPPSGTSIPTESLQCSNPSLEDGDGICTCTQGTVTTTITPAGGPGNTCPTALTGPLPSGTHPSTTLVRSTTPAPPRTAGLDCSNPSLEDGDGICTCTQGTITTTITPAGGPGNTCPTALPAPTTTATSLISPVSNTITSPIITNLGPTSTNKPPTCMHNPVDEDPSNCTNPSSTSQPFSCSAGSNIGLATYDPATWCGCNSPTGTLYPTLPSGSGDAACAYTTPPSQTVNPTRVTHPATTPQPALSAAD
ncbi:MAG: hypothetical protein Q9201_005989 [Fulgogasparrea decipioides]